MQAEADTANEQAQVDLQVAVARAAQQQYEHNADQARYDRTALAAAWALMEPRRNEAISTLAVSSTGLGNVRDKIRKNHRKTLGLLRDIEGAITTGVIANDDSLGITQLARAIGVIGAVVPSTNPAATPTNNVINALKCGNAIILSPSPAGVEVCKLLINYIHAEFEKIGADPDLVQMIAAPSSKNKTQRLMEASDLIIVTGSQDNVRRAYSSGTPAIGVGAGNATVIVDETANLAKAAADIAASKTFDNATSCSSENVLVVVDAIYDKFVAAITKVGGRILDEADSLKIKQALFQRGHLNRNMIAKDIGPFLKVAKLTVNNPEKARFVVLPAAGIGPEYPESGEKLSLALTLFRASDFDHARALASEVLQYQGAGHSVGLHSSLDERAIDLGRTLPTCRVIVNQAHCFATGGSFENGMPFSLSMGCGSWGGNSIDTNLNYRHFMNVTHIVRPIPTNEPSLEYIFSAYWQIAGQ